MNSISLWLESMGIPPLLGGLIAGAVLFWLISRMASDDRTAKLMGQDAVPKPAVELSDRDRALVRRLMRQDEKIEAIKLVRERTGLGLADAKEFVEELDEK